MQLTLQTTIHAALAAHPELLDVLVAQSPAFARLQNPVLRRTLTRLTTVQQAAAIARLDPNALLHSLNAAIRAPTLPSPAAPPAAPAADAAPNAAPAAPPAWFAAPLAAELDVRPLIAAGAAPLHQILAVAAEVPMGQQFVLRAPFEPVPLYRVLGKRGFQPHAVCLGPEHWEVRFYHAGASCPETPPPTPLQEIDAWEHAAVTITIDVRDLVPPEPTQRILEAAAALGTGQCLLVHHARYPVYLFPHLEAQGYEHLSRARADGGTDLLITRPQGG